MFAESDLSGIVGAVAVSLAAPSPSELENWRAAMNRECLPGVRTSSGSRRGRGLRGGHLGKRRRVPLILIALWARCVGVMKDSGDHASFAKFIDVLFDLLPLAYCPTRNVICRRDPSDTPQATDLLGGFDPMTLSG